MTPEQKDAYYRIAEELIARQNFGGAVIFGLAATFLAAALWAVVAVAAGYVVGYMALALGAIIGVTVRFIGRGVEDRFAILAVVLAVCGCLLGNLFSSVFVEAKFTGATISRVLGELNVDQVLRSIFGSLQLIDIAFWLLAAFTAGFFAKRALTKEQGVALHTLRRKPDAQKIVD